jgi:2'-phosphotransferase
MDDIAESFEETVNIRHDKGKGRAGGRGGGRGSGRGGGGGASRDVLLSKALSKLLRHQAVSAGIQLDREGYAPLDRVVSLTIFFSIFEELSSVT